jgi:hypothetical protein
MYVTKILILCIAKALKRAKSLDELKIKSLAIIRLILMLSQFF